MRVVHSPAHREHVPPFELTNGAQVDAYELPERAEAILRALDSDGSFELVEPAEHGSEPILAVHDRGLFDYLDSAWAEWVKGGTGSPFIIPDVTVTPALREGMGPAPEPDSPCGRVGYWCFDTATPIVAGTYAAARAAVDAALTATDAVLAGEPVAYALCRPPGHHAARSAFGGYCYFNNAAVVAESLVQRTGEPVAILDVDFHHGNGTQQMFYERGDVFYASLHGDPRAHYPYFAGYAEESGDGPGRGATFNQPLPAGTGVEPYLEALDRALERVAAFGGSTLVVSLGIDTYRLDPICTFKLTTASYHEAGRRVASTGRRLVVLQEGGYHVGHLGENVRQWLRGAAGLPSNERLTAAAGG
jgi:acetoin utilization deacetylase AcuC-like enzyme